MLLRNVYSVLISRPKRKRELKDLGCESSTSYSECFTLRRSSKDIAGRCFNIHVIIVIYSVFFILCTRTARGTCENLTDTRKKEKVFLLIIKLDTCGVVFIPSVSNIIKSAAIKLSPLAYRESLQCVLMGMGVDVTTWQWTVFFGSQNAGRTVECAYMAVW